MAEGSTRTAGHGSPAAPEPPEAPQAAGHGARPAVLALAVVVALVAGLAVGLLLAGLGGGPATPGDTSVEAGFARDMQVHHEQAVAMSVLVRDRTTDPEVRQLALDIELTQQQQAGQMFGWLELWGLPQASAGPVMGWMGEDHAHGGEPAPEAGSLLDMPGFVTDEQMARLEAATGTEAERVYLALMIPHHEGGVEMAEVAAERTTLPAVRRLASAVVAAQETELTVLHDMLDARGGAPDGL